jgi:hypothetical protein
MLAHVVKHMATKDDVRAIVRDELKLIHSDLKSIRDEFDDLTEKPENVSGFRKEIDHALGRIAAIEKHLGINKKIAARSTPSTTSPPNNAAIRQRPPAQSASSLRPGEGT